VDFLVRFHDGREELIQVCAELGTAETRERECQALAEAAREHPRATQRLLVLNSDQRAVQVPEAVTVQPAYLRQALAVTLSVRPCPRLFRQLHFRLRKPRPLVVSADSEPPAADNKTP
jgi:hypothetical protein